MFLFFSTCFWEMYLSGLSWRVESRARWVGCFGGKDGKRGRRRGIFAASFQGLLSSGHLPHLFSHRTSSQPLDLQDKSLPSLLGSVSGKRFLSLSVRCLHPPIFSWCSYRSPNPSRNLELDRDPLEFSKYPSSGCTDARQLEDLRVSVCFYF